MVKSPFAVLVTVGVAVVDPFGLAQLVTGVAAINNNDGRTI